MIIPHGTKMVRDGGFFRPAKPDEEATHELVGNWDTNALRNDPDVMIWPKTSYMCVVPVGTLDSPSRKP